MQATLNRASLRFHFQKGGDLMFDDPGYAADIFYYTASLIFGVAAAAMIAGIGSSRRSIGILLVFTAADLCLQGILLTAFGMDFVIKIYPLVTHFPLVLLLIFAFRRSWWLSIAAVLTSYCCCQVPHWIALLLNDSIGNPLFYTGVYIVMVSLFIFIMWKYFSNQVVILFSCSRKICLEFALMPLFYYIFDYCTSIYSKLIFSSRLAVEMFPTFMIFWYFIVVIAFFSENQRQEKADSELAIKSVQLHAAETALSSLRKNQEQTAAYRHDLRHHIIAIRSLASDGRTAEILDYLKTAGQQLDAITPLRCCDNEIVNLLLTHYAGEAEAKNVTLTADAMLPAKLTLTDNELCSILANGLDNALTAAKKAGDPAARKIDVKIRLHNGNMAIQITNGCENCAVPADDVPANMTTGHGFGLKNIKTITAQHNGLVSVSAESGTFSLRIMIPLQ